MPEDDKMSCRELESKIMEMKREKTRCEDNVRRMESNQKRITQERERILSPEPLVPTTGTMAIENLKPLDESQKEEKKVEKKDDDKDDKDDEKKDEDAKSEGGKKRKRSRSGSSSSSRSGRRNPKERRKQMDSRPSVAKPDARSRNLFGGLMRHLQKAKVGLDTEKTSDKWKQQQEAKAKADQKLIMEKVNLQELRKRQFETKRKEEEEKADNMCKDIEEMELLLLRTRLERHYGHMMHFIRTKAEPTIFYLPSKGNRETDKMLDETRAAIKHKIASLKVQLQPIEMPLMPAVEDVPREKKSRKEEKATAIEDKKEAAAVEDKKDDASGSEDESVARGSPKNDDEAKEKEKEKKGDDDKKDDKEDKKDGEGSDKEDDKKDKDDDKKDD